MVFTRLLLLLPLLAPPCGRPVATGGPILPAVLRIATITTAAQAERFVQAYRAEYHTFRLLALPTAQQRQPFLLPLPVQPYLDHRDQRRPPQSVGQEPAGRVDCSDVRACLGAQQLSSWRKSDLDGNGRADLLAYGYLVGRLQLASCFLDLGGGKVREVPLARAYGDPCYLLQVVRLQGRPVLQRATRAALSASAPTTTRRCQVDTLVYHQTGFVEYNAHPSDYRIERISLTTTPCYGSCPIFTLQVDRQRHGRYEARQHVPRLGVFTTTVEPKAFQALWSLVNYINFPQLPSKPRAFNIDASVYLLTITYAGGKQKIIGNEAGQAATLGLDRVYEQLLALRDSQAWR